MTRIGFDGRVAIVTGGGNGLGRAYCLELARRGAHVVVNDLGGSGSGAGSSSAPAQAVVGEIKAAGGSAVASFDSVASREGGENIVRTALDAFGKLDILIANAGILRNARFEDLTEDQVRPVLETHLMAGFYVGQPAFRAMRKNGYGRFLFTGSSSAMFGHPWQANYAAAKGGLFGISNVVALEGEQLGILSNVLLPTGATRLASEMSQGFLEVPRVAGTIGRIDFAALGGRLTVEHNVPMALYLVSEASTETHGVFASLGGRYARVVVAACEGWLHDEETPPTLETLAENWALIEAPGSQDRPYSVYEEMEAVQDRLTGQATKRG